jgi:hypothetical protein
MWLLMLIAAMEEASRPEFRAKRCDRELLDRVMSHLAQPASPRAPYRYSNFSLRKWIPAYSPAICSRGLRPRSTPRSFASSRKM